MYVLYILCVTWHVYVIYATSMLIVLLFLVYHTKTLIFKVISQDFTKVSNKASTI